MKVLFIIDTLETGGAEKSLVEITTEFIKVKPVFIQIYEGSDLKPKLEAKGITVFSLNIKEKYGYNKALLKIRPIIDQIKPDIIHSTLYRSDIISRKIKTDYKIPLINSLVSNSYSAKRFEKLLFSRKFKLKVIQLIDRYTAKKVDLFVSNSNIIKKDNARTLNLHQNKITVIPRGRNRELFSFSAEQINLLKKEYDYLGKTVILNVGRLIKSKGQDDLILAFSKIVATNPNLILLIAGEGDFRTTLEMKIKDLNLSDKVFLLGNRKDIPQLLAIAEIFVFPTYLEGMPGSLIEAMMSKTLIVCSDIPENRECLPDTFGLFYKTGDIENLKSQILYSLNNLNKLKGKIQDAYDYSIKNYEIKKIASIYEVTYNELLNKKI